MTNLPDAYLSFVICHLLSVICHPDELQTSTGRGARPDPSYITKRSMNPSTGVSRSREESAKRDAIRLEFSSEILLRKLFSNFFKQSRVPPSLAFGGDRPNGVFRHYFFGGRTVLKEDLDGVADRTFFRIQIIFTELRILPITSIFSRRASIRGSVAAEST